MWPKKVNLLCAHSLPSLTHTLRELGDSKGQTIRLFDLRAVDVFITMKGGLASARLTTRCVNKASLINYTCLCASETICVCVSPVCCSKDLDLVGILLTLESGPHAICLLHCGFEIQFFSLHVFLASHQSQLSFQKPQALVNIAKKGGLISTSLFFHPCKSLPSVCLPLLNVLHPLLFFSLTDCFRYQQLPPFKVSLNTVSDFLVSLSSIFHLSLYLSWFYLPTLDICASLIQSPHHCAYKHGIIITR